MPFNGAGAFTRLYNWVQDKTNGIKVNATRMDAEMDGIAAGLSNCITKDGQTTLTANIPFNNRKLTNLGDATVDTDALNRQTADGRYVRQATGAGAPLVINAAGGTETDLGMSDEVRLTVAFTATLPRMFLTAKMQIDNTTIANIVWLTLELTDGTGTTVVDSVGQPFSAAASSAAAGHGFLALPVNVTVGTAYQARIKVRKDVAAGPIYPRRMTISGANF